MTLNIKYNFSNKCITLKFPNISIVYNHSGFIHQLETILKYNKVCYSKHKGLNLNNSYQISTPKNYPLLRI